MLGENKHNEQRTFFILGDLYGLIPDDHILKRVDKVLDLGWIRDEVRSLYTEKTGRPSIDPESAVRLMLAGFFHGVVHDRKLMRETQVNLAYRWFAGYGIEDEIPDHSTLSKLRKRWGVETFRRIFKRTVMQCVEAGLVDVETLHVDATLIRADVSMESLVTKHVEEVVNENGDLEIDGGSRPENKKQKVSRTDPDASVTKSTSFDKPLPRYKQHTAVDDRSGVVVDVGVTTGRTPEASQLIGQLERVEENTGMRPSKVTADKSYSKGIIYEALEKLNVDAVIPTKVVPANKTIPLRRFKYDAKHDHVKCPEGKILHRNIIKTSKGWRYTAKTTDCQACRLKDRCVPASLRSRNVRIVDGYMSLLRARRKEIREPATRSEEYMRHKFLVEGRHGEAKEFHGLRRAVRRGLEQVAIQVLMTAAAMNLKRLAGAFHALFGVFISEMRLRRNHQRFRISFSGNNCP